MLQTKIMRWGNPDNEPEPRGTIKLPCGAVGVADGCGYRCLDCMTIYGSIACRCSRSGDEQNG